MAHGLNFGDDPDHRPDPEVRNLDSLDYQKEPVDSDQSCIANLHSKIIQQFYYAGVRRRSVLPEYF